MYKELLSESTLRLRWRYKQLLSKSNTYTGDINSCILKQPLRWWHIPTLEVQLLQPYAGGINSKQCCFIVYKSTPHA